MSTEIVVDVRTGVVIISCPRTKQRKIVPRDETGKVTLTIPDKLDGVRNDHPDAEKPDKPWQPLHPAVPVTDSMPPAMKAAIAESNEQMWKNDLYTVTRSEWKYPRTQEDPDAPVLIHLSIRRNDRLPVTDWRHKQKIKNQLAGEDCEAVELYPAEDRLVDTSNQFHLWCFPAGFRVPVGYEDGRVTFGQPLLDGAKQRPFVDGEFESKTPEEMQEMITSYKGEDKQRLRDAHKRAQELA